MQFMLKQKKHKIVMVISMKKKKIITIMLIITIILSIIFFYKRDKLEYHLHTTTEDNKNYVISITYPSTNISKLDKEIIKYINIETNKFKKNINKSVYLLERNELNIDFDYEVLNNNYISIILKVSNYNGINKQVNNTIYMILYDLKKDKKINILDLFYEPENVISEIKKEFIKKYNITIANTNNIYITISENKLIAYTITDDIYSISLSIKNLNFKLNIQKLKENNNLLTTEKVTNIIDPTKPVVAITFDDGPSKYTEEIIETLKENNCNATFFVLGNKVEAYQDIIRKSIKNGNEIGNHTYNHKWLSRLSTNEIIDQITKTQNILQETIGYTPTYLRPTYGSVNQRIKKNTNLKIALWTIDTKDWKIKNVDRIVEKAIENIEDGDIILMHDIFKRSSDALKKLIPILKEQGFQPVTISELEEIKLLRTKF